MTATMTSRPRARRWPCLLRSARSAIRLDVGETAAPRRRRRRRLASDPAAARDRPVGERAAIVEDCVDAVARRARFAERALSMASGPALRPGRSPGSDQGVSWHRTVAGRGAAAPTRSRSRSTRPATRCAHRVCYTTPTRPAAPARRSCLNRSTCRRGDPELELDLRRHRGRAEAPSGKNVDEPDLSIFATPRWTPITRSTVPNYRRAALGQALCSRAGLKSLDIDYTLFNPDGTPLRAKAKASFVGFTGEDATAAPRRTSDSPDLTPCRPVERATRCRAVRPHLRRQHLLYHGRRANGLTCFRDLDARHRRCSSRRGVSGTARIVNAPSPEIESRPPDRVRRSRSTARPSTPIPIVSIETWSEANRIPRGRIVIYDGAADSEAFPLSEFEHLRSRARSSSSRPATVTRSATIHSGRIVRHSLRIVPGASAAADRRDRRSAGQDDARPQQRPSPRKPRTHTLIAKLVKADDGSDSATTKRAPRRSKPSSSIMPPTGT